MILKDAVRAWSYLDGIVCIYKPPVETMNSLRRKLLFKLCQDLNSLKCRDIKPYVEITGDTSKPLSVEVKKNYADHPLAVGPRYIPEDFRLSYVNKVGIRSSGVCVVGVNDGCKLAQEYADASPLKVYHVKGRLGISTNTFFADGKPKFKCNYKYLTTDDINRVIAAVQANHQKNLFHLTGVNLQSQGAYEMAASGLIRPAMKNAPVIYNIKCIDFSSPDFTLEITCANEDEEYLLQLILDVGYHLKNVASTVSIRCIRVGFFSVELALLKKHFTLENILSNMRSCYQIFEKSKKMGLELHKLEGESVPVMNENEIDLEVVDEEIKEVDQEFKEVDVVLKEFDPELKAY